jgi:crotonobetaine/carnitine-CoA ligase
MDRERALPNLLAARAARDPDGVLLRDVGGEERSAGAFEAGARRWAGALRGLGVGAGDTVLVMQPASIAAFELWTAVALLHAIEVPVNTQQRGNLLAHIVNDSRARVIVADARYAEVILEQRERYRTLETLVVTGGPASAGALAADALLAAAAPLEEAVIVEPWDIACVLYTSGTTGPSKGVLVPWAQAHATAMGNGPDRSLRTPDTVIYSPYPTFHVSGKYSLYNALLGGGHVVVRERFDTARFWDEVRAFGCTYTILMGTTANFLQRQPERPDDADNPLRAVLFSPWTDEVEAFKARFGVEAFSVFNMTEVSCPIVAGWDGGPVTKPKSCGRPRPGYTLRVVDEHDAEVPAGTPGELVLRTDEPWTLMAGYWQLPEKTLEAWRNQWLHTGDTFMVDADGDYFYLDRKKDAIRRRGENISSTEVEAEVLAHPGVLEVAAVAVPDEISEQEVKIVVVPKPGAELEPADLIAFLAERMARFMVPRYVELAAALPKTPTEKIRKTELRAAGVTAETWDREAAGIVLKR